MIDQLIIGNKASFDDFGASIAKRIIGMPSKKTIKETVPFSNKTYDFTDINGEIYWDERELKYIFEMSAARPELLEDMKTAFSGWVMNVIEEELHDPIITDHHFIASYEDMEFEDEESLDKTTVTVVFMAYPYKIANHPKVLEKVIPAKSTATIRIINDSAHKITPTITADQKITITFDGLSYSMNAGTAKDETFQLYPELNSFTVTNSNSAACNLNISFFEEVF